MTNRLCQSTEGRLIGDWVVYEHLVVQALAQSYALDKQHWHCYTNIDKTVRMSIVYNPSDVQLNFFGRTTAAEKNLKLTIAVGVETERNLPTTSRKTNSKIEQN